MKVVFFGIVIYDIFLNPPSSLMHQVPGNSPTFHRADALYPGKKPQCFLHNAFPLLRLYTVVLINVFLNVSFELQ